MRSRAAREDGPHCSANNKGHDADCDLPATVEKAKSENDSAHAGSHRNGGIDPNWRVSSTQRTNRQRQAYNDKWQRNNLKQAAPDRLSTIDHEGCRNAKYAIYRYLNRDRAQEISRLPAEPQRRLHKLHQTCGGNSGIGNTTKPARLAAKIDNFVSVFGDILSSV
jgi:hypothetical protein